MINAEQIRVARAILDWSTADLAKLTGMTINGINKIERGHVVPQKETLRNLQHVFELAGLEFLPGSGVKKKERILIVDEGPDANKNLAFDVYNTLQDTGGELLLVFADEKRSIDDIGEDYLREQCLRRSQANIRHRIMISESKPYRFPWLPSESYRILPEKYFTSNPFFIYGPKIALLTSLPERKVIFINDERFAESLTKLFNFVWDHSSPLPA